jgi:hypothetical protein
MAYLPEVIGVAAAAASLYAAYSRTIISLRVAAIVANALAMMYSYRTELIHLRAQCDLPFEFWRLHLMVKLVRDIETATKSDMNVDWLLPTRVRSISGRAISSWSVEHMPPRRSTSSG